LDYGSLESYPPLEQGQKKTKNKKEAPLPRQARTSRHHCNPVTPFTVSISEYNFPVTHLREHCQQNSSRHFSAHGNSGKQEGTGLGATLAPGAKNGFCDSSARKKYLRIAFFKPNFLVARMGG
jgi:hypothetical protein